MKRRMSRSSTTSAGLLVASAEGRVRKSPPQPRPAAVTLRFSLTFLALVMLFSILVSLDVYLFDGATGKLATTCVAHIAGLMLSLLDANVVTSGNLISYKSSAFEIVTDCTGIEVIELFVAAVLAFPTRWHYRLAGLGLGIPTLGVLNLIRVVTLISVGGRWPEALHYGHLYVWPAIVLAAALGMWVYWARLATDDARLLA